MLTGISATELDRVDDCSEHFMHLHAQPVLIWQEISHRHKSICGRPHMIGAVEVPDRKAAPCCSAWRLGSSLACTG